ncbi:aldehyde dehydrogenase family protein [Blattabacterium sp. (Blaberus giganteus)]|uniref:aldehyde dehydrogenase family protein n=1 Tax=Blattabacterium sp. (Blaberus giganteus) TaxID=1186051 RepID=UPI00025F7005|nr:aldehyde dehydrogenase family protein [Blattabacterium sp. (Blaberus giganteus)]AFJ90939.1 succinate-semialdehyde dehydrogenase [Blattabacterium sp. (Blaberus giganteus)]
MFQTINPVDDNVLKTYYLLSNKDINIKLSEAHHAYMKWKNFSFNYKVQCLMKLYFCMQKSIDIIAYSITQEMGKPITQSYAEVNKSIDLCKHYCELKESIFMKKIHTEYEFSYVKFESLGAILGIMPWNYPIWQTIRSTIPNLLLGNVILIKPAFNTTGSSLILEKIFLESGFPKGVFQILLIDVNKIEPVIAHPVIQGVTFTGSALIGSIIGSLSGKYIKKSILELGGNDAFVVMKDVENIEKIAKLATESRLNNTGQTCISAKRFIVDKTIIDDFIDAVIQEMKTYQRGNLYDESTKIGYISRYDLSEKLYQQYKDIIINGGKICLEITKDGNFFSPSLLRVEYDNCIVKKEEIFGPIGIIFSFSQEKIIPDIINDTLYGLGASIWTKDLEKAEEISKKIDTGMVFINEIVKSDPRFPFGGVKKSGYGRELSSLSIKEFSNWKTVIINKS